jgi:hypothetical protein
MIRKSFSFLMLALLLTVQQAAANDQVEALDFNINEASVSERAEIIPFCNHIVSTALFEGDADKNFIGDYVVVLDNGSAWKIHPEDAVAYSKWYIDDLVQPFARTSFYWFKREHKFMLHNYSRNERLRVMLVSYPTAPLFITSAQEVAVGGHWEHTRVLDGSNQWVKVSTWVIDYKRNLYLNDGSIGLIANDARFTAGRFISPGINNDGDRFWYFLALGLQKDSFWIKAERLY